MKRKLIAFILVILCIFNLTGCKSVEQTRYQAEFLTLFDTVTTIVGYAQDKEAFTEYAQMIYDNLLEYHQFYDKYNDYEGLNNIKTVNDNAGIKAVKVDQRIIDLLFFAKDKYQLTEGKVNIAFGAVLEVWHQYRTEGVEDPENAELPPMDILQEKAEHTDINKLIINETESTVYLDDPDMRLDVGAIAKGYATEMVARIAIENGFINGMISVGGNVRTVGEKENGQAWNVAVQNPDMESDEANLYILKLKDYSLVTSGDYQRYYTVKGKQYHHIIDPDTLMPADYFTAVSILCEDSGLADAFSTAVYNMSYDNGLSLIEAQPNTEALWVLKNGDIKFSSNFEGYVRD